MLILLHITDGCFCAIIAEVSRCDRDGTTRKGKSTHYLAGPLQRTSGGSCFRQVTLAEEGVSSRGQCEGIGTQLSRAQGLARLKQTAGRHRGDGETYQKEGAHSGDFVQFHKQPQGLLVVAAVFLVHAELVLLQDKNRG